MNDIVWFRITPSLNNVNRFLQADSKDDAMLKAANAAGYSSVDELNDNLEGESLSATEISNEYIEKLKFITKEVGVVSSEILMCKEEWRPTVAVKEAIKFAIAHCGISNDLHRASNRIGFDLEDFGVRYGDWMYTKVIEIGGESGTGIEKNLDTSPSPGM